MDVNVTFIGNATTLIEAGGITVLTDPNFLHQGQHAYLGYGLVSKRLHGPALRVEELPPIDVIVLSHLHGDHWDRVAQRGLDHGLPVVTTTHAAKRLRHRGFGAALGLSTWSAAHAHQGADHVDCDRTAGAARAWLDEEAASASDGFHAGVRSHRRFGPAPPLRVRGHPADR